MTTAVCARCGATGPAEDFSWRYCWKCVKRKQFCHTYCRGETGSQTEMVCARCDPVGARKHAQRTAQNPQRLF